MNYSEDMMLRYLCGELSEAERTEIEREYFTDPATRDRLIQFEDDLLDDYARGRLAPEMRARIERTYLTRAARRDRLNFSRALATRLDQTAAQTAHAEIAPLSPAPKENTQWWPRVRTVFALQRPALAFSLGLILLLLAAGSLWLFIQTRRLRGDLAREQAAQAEQEQRRRELEQQLADERKRNQELTAQLPHPENSNTPSPKASPPAFVALLLFANDLRSGAAGPAATLMIPKGTDEVRLQLELKDNDYASYQLSLRPVGGAEIFNSNSTPRLTKSGAIFSFSLPAAKFVSGDYLLTLRGARSGEFEDVSKSLFRVEKK